MVWIPIILGVSLINQFFCTSNEIRIQDCCALSYALSYLLLWQCYQFFMELCDVITQPHRRMTITLPRKLPLYMDIKNSVIRSNLRVIAISAGLFSVNRWYDTLCVTGNRYFFLKRVRCFGYEEIQEHNLPLNFLKLLMIGWIHWLLIRDLETRLTTGSDSGKDMNKLLHLLFPEKRYYSSMPWLQVTISLESLANDMLASRCFTWMHCKILPRMFVHHTLYIGPSFCTACVQMEHDAIASLSSNGSAAFRWKLRCHRLKGLRQRQIAVTLQNASLWVYDLPWVAPMSSLAPANAIDPCANTACQYSPGTASLPQRVAH